MSTLSDRYIRGVFAVLTLLALLLVGGVLMGNSRVLAQNASAGAPAAPLACSSNTVNKTGNAPGFNTGTITYCADAGATSSTVFTVCDYFTSVAGGCPGADRLANTTITFTCTNCTFTSTNSNTVTFNTANCPTFTVTDVTQPVSISYDVVGGVPPNPNGNHGEKNFVQVTGASQTTHACGPSFNENATNTPTSPPVTATSTSTNTPTQTPTNTATNTPTNTPSNTPTATNTPTNTPSNTPTATNTPSNTPTATNTPSNTPTATNTPSNTPTATNTPSNTPSNTPTATNTPSNTPTNTPTSTATPCSSVNPCSFIKSPGFWAQQHPGYTDAQFQSFLNQTDFAPITIAQAQCLLRPNCGHDMVGRAILTAELNVAANPLLGTSVYHLAGSSVDGLTVNQIIAQAYALYHSGQTLPSDLANAIGYISGGALGDGGSGEGQPPGNCRLQEPCTTPTTTPTNTPTNTAIVPTRTPSNTPTNTAIVPTRTPSNTPTNTAVVPTRTPSNTPTNTAIVPTRTPSNTPTNTAVVPTRTPSNTPTTTCVPETPVVVVTPAFTPGPGCSLTPAPGVVTAVITDHPGTTSAVFHNYSTTCSYPIGLASYRMFDSTITHQELFDYALAVIPPGGTLTLTVNNPSCAYQADAFYGNLIVSFAGGQTYGERRLDDTHGNDGNYCTHACAPSATPTPYAIAFTDVPAGSPFYPFISCLVHRNIVGGYSDNTFRPGADVTRGQLAKFVSNAAGYGDSIPAGRQTFGDVPGGSPFWVFVERAALHGVVSGYSDHTFRPGNSVTRGQVAKFVSNAAGYNEAVPSTRQTFSDVPASDTFWLYIERVYAHGVVSGYSDHTFRPVANVTRGQTSKFIANTFFPNCNPIQP